MEVETISSGNDTVVFAATAADNGKDTITGFEAGNGKDVLDVSAFLGSGTTISVAEVTANSSPAEVTAGTNVIKLTHTTDATDKVKFAAKGNYVVLYDADSSTSTEKTKVYYYTATGNATDEIAVSSIVADVNLVATTDVNEVTSFTSANFIA